jgi:dihydroxyacetone kinase-like protein
VEGEKTMLDALFPAARAARSSLDGGSDLAAITAAARDAAAAGAEATIPMLATKGRASYLGERSVGHQDPGATSAALLLAVLAETAAADSTDPAAATA